MSKKTNLAVITQMDSPDDYNMKRIIIQAGELLKLSHYSADGDVQQVILELAEAVAKYDETTVMQRIEDKEINDVWNNVFST